MKNKFLLVTVLVFRLLSFPQDIYALPELAEIISGSADYVQVGNTLTITVHSDQFIANYHSFSIAANEIVRFIQPHVTSTALNRDIGGSASMIYGVLTSNGIIFLVNASGINFGPTAQVNVGGLVASTLNLSDADFLARDYNFEGAGGFIGVDQGALLSSPGGYVILFSGAIRNDGTIEANLGKVVLATGEEITLELDPLGEISVVVHKAVMRAIFNLDGEKVGSSIENNGKILAEGGKIVINADVLNDIFDHAINNTGIIEAAALIDKGGEIALVAQNAPVSNTGIIEAHDIDIDVIDSNMINEGAIIADGNDILTDGGYISIEAKNILQSGTVSANAHEGGTAGDIEIVAEDLLLLDDGSITSAASPVSFLVGEGGNILLNSTEGDTIVLEEAIIDVSGGTEAGDAGFVEISAKERIGFYGILNGGAAVGYMAARVLFDPRNITIASGGGDTPTSDIFPGADEASGDHGNSNITIDPLALAAMTAAEIFLQATRDIIINSAISVDTSIKFEADRHINVNANVTASGGITMTADADANNSGNFKMAAGTTLSDTSSGNITVTSADTLTINNLSTIGGDVSITNHEAGKNVTVNGTIASNGGAIAITAKKNVVTKGAITSGAGNVTITANSDADASGKADLQASITTTTGTVTVTSSDTAKIDDITTQGADISITNNEASGNIDLNGAIDSNGGAIAITSKNNITSNGTIASDAGTMTLTADSDNTSAGRVNLKAGISATTGNITIATSDSAQLDTVTTQGGNVTVTNNDASGDINANENVVTNGGALSFTAGDDVIVDKTITTAGGAVTLSAKDDVTTKDTVSAEAGVVAITADSDSSGAGNVNIQNVISTTTGTITISSSDVAQIDGLITQGAAVTITNNDAGGDVNANGSIATNGGALNVTANDNIAFDKTVMTGGGIVTVSAGDNVTVSDAMSSGGAAITVTADSDNNNVGNLDIDAAVSSTGGTINLKGNNLLLDTGTGSVSGGTGNVTISSSGSNRTLGLGTGGSNFNISDAEFDRISTTGTLQIGDTSTGTMTVGTLTTTTIFDLKLVADDMTINTSLNVGTGNLSLIPADNGRTIGLGSGAASNFNISDTEMDRITTTGTVIVGDANSGRISVSGLTPASFTKLSLVSGGNIDDTGAADAVTIDTLSLNGASIGSTTPFNVNVSTFNATATGSINVVEADGATFGTVTGDGAVTVAVTAGNLTINTGTITSNNAGVDVTITNGSILASGAGPHIKADGDSSISLTGGTITATGTVLKVDIGGDLTLDMPNAGVVGGNSGILSGDVSSGGIPLLINTNFPTPQLPAGNILFNGAKIWPSTPGVTGSTGGGVILLTARNQSIDGLDRRLEDIYDLNIERHRLSLGDTGEPLFFFYHPLTPIDYSAFDDIVMDEEAYEFVENLLKVKEGAPDYFGITVEQ